MTAKIYTIDLEVMPMLSYHWKRWKENIHLAQTEHEAYLASWAARKLGDTEVQYDGLNKYTMSMEDEAGVAASLWKVFDDADILVHFNGDAFDIKVANTAFARYGFKPPSPYKSIDLMKLIKKRFRLSSNSLKSACKFFDVEQKMDNSGWHLWVDCVKKEPKAWAEMEEYNKQDIIATEALYERLKGWHPNHPNVNLYTPGAAPHSCPNCGSHKVKKNGVETLTAMQYQRYKCTSCGANLRGASAINEKADRDVLLKGVK